MVADEGLKFVVNLHEAGVGVAGSRIFDGAGSQDDRFFGGSLQNGKAGGPEGGVEREDPHGGDRAKRGKEVEGGPVDPEKTRG